MVVTRYPGVHVEITGDANAHRTLWTTVDAMRSAGVPEDDVDAFWEEARSGDYGNVLRTAMKYVSVHYTPT